MPRAVQRADTLPMQRAMAYSRAYDAINRRANVDNLRTATGTSRWQSAREYRNDIETRTQSGLYAMRDFLRDNGGNYQRTRTETQRRIDEATGVLTRTPEARAKRMAEAYSTLFDVDMIGELKEGNSKDTGNSGS